MSRIKITKHLSLDEVHKKWMEAKQKGDSKALRWDVIYHSYYPENTVSAIAGMVRKSEGFCHYWIKQYSQDPCLLDPGRKEYKHRDHWKIPESVRNELNSLLRDPVGNDLSTGPAIQNWLLEKHNIHISRQSCTRLLRQSGYKPIPNYLKARKLKRK